MVKMSKYIDSLKEPDDGIDYKPLYYNLFNGITTVIETSCTYDEIIATLKQLQIEAEDTFIVQSK